MKQDHLPAQENQWGQGGYGTEEWGIGEEMGEEEEEQRSW